MCRMAEFVVREAILPDLKETVKDGVVREMVRSLQAAGYFAGCETDEIVKAILRREQLGSTGIGRHIAIPHAKHPSLDKLVGTIGLSKAGVQFDSIDAQPVHVLVLLISPKGRILGYTAGNDMSSRDIEGENPLYLPQAKVYDGSCAVGPTFVVNADPIAPDTRIDLEIRRGAGTEFTGSTSVSEMKRDFPTLVEYLYRETSFPNGCLLFTGTGVVPPDGFTLQAGDEIFVTVGLAGTLHNTVG